MNKTDKNALTLFLLILAANQGIWFFAVRKANKDFDWMFKKNLELFQVIEIMKKHCDPRALNKDLDEYENFRKIMKGL